MLFLDAGSDSDVLNYDAGGEVPTITAGPLPDEVLITIPGAGIVDALYYNTINITDAAVPPAPVVVTTPTINTIEGFQFVNAVLGTFTFPIAPNFPVGTTLPAGLPASDFTATFAWGDGTTIGCHNRPGCERPERLLRRGDAYLREPRALYDRADRQLRRWHGFGGRQRHAGYDYSTRVNRRARGDHHSVGDRRRFGRHGLPDHRNGRVADRRGPDCHLHRRWWCPSGRRLYGVDLHHRFRRVVANCPGGHHRPGRHVGPVYRHGPGHHAA